jgi:uncharacterized membrane protein
VIVTCVRNVDMKGDIMTAGHLHLILNHFPVIGSVIVLLLLMLAVYGGSNDVARAALSLAVLVGVVSLVVYFTGEPAESLIERLPGFSEDLTERHEDAALVATILVGVTSVLALAVLATHRRGRSLPRRTIATATGISLVACGALGYTAFLGGQIRHTEIRPGNSASAVAGEHEGTDR